MSCLVNAVIPASQYMIAPSLQQDFIDKDTGELLAYGIVTFYRDADHTQLKPVYAVSGPPDDPIFTELPNPLTLSGIGTFIDPNNDQDIIPYYRPFDADGNVDLYYITVYSADNVLQFTRDHYPSVDVSSNTTILQVENFIPNGQFLMHLDLEDDGLIPSTADFIAIGYGGWFFEQTPNTSAINYVNFLRYDAPSDIPDQNPRYAVEIKCTFANPSDGNKDLFNAIKNVNFMQGQDLTFQFTGYSNDGNDHNVNFIISQYFGSGGSPEVDTVIETITITPEIQNFNIQFTMPSTLGKTLSSSDDDGIRLVLRSPLPSSSDITYTDFFMVQGTFVNLTYPPTTPEEDKAFTLPASYDLPAYDGSDRGKFVTLDYNRSNELGFTYINAVPTGTIIMSGISTTTPPEGYLYGDGSEYDRSSPLYLNLFNTIGWGYGRGINGFINASINSNTYSVIWSRYDIAQPIPNAGTSGFIYTLILPVTPGIQAQEYYLTVLAGSSIIPGSYFTQPVNTGGPQFIQLFWMTIDGIGTIPNVTHDVATRIDILSTDTVTQVRDKLISFANGMFMVPDLRGYFPRFWDNGAGRDPYANARAEAGGGYPTFPFLLPSGHLVDQVFSVQASSNKSHNHPDPTGFISPNMNLYAREVFPVTGNTVDISSGGSTTQLTEPLWTDPCDAAGTGTSSESRPINIYVNGFIKI